jgi:acyl carrier protein
MDTGTIVEEFIVDELIIGSKGQKIDYDESLVSKGVIDSLAILRLISFIEEKFNVKVNDDEVVLENFETINIIVKFIDDKLANSDGE